MQKRKTFSKGFMRKAAEFARQLGASTAGIERNLGIGAHSRSRWCREQEVRTVPAGFASSIAAWDQERDSKRRELVAAKIKTARHRLST